MSTFVILWLVLGLVVVGWDAFTLRETVQQLTRRVERLEAEREDVPRATSDEDST